MSQPALSRQIQTLEAGVGAKLFHRHARGLVMTHEGEQLHRATRDMSETIDRTRAGIEALARLPSHRRDPPDDDGQLRIDLAGAADGLISSTCIPTST